MSKVRDESLRHYEACFDSLVINTTNGRASPHKICMLLAVLDLALAGGLRQNRIVYAPPLLERYRRYFDTVRREGDHPNAYFPFFHLKGRLRTGRPSFWHLVPRAGCEVVVAAMDTARSDSAIVQRIDHVRLDDALFDLLQDADATIALSDAIARRWFERGLQELNRMAQHSRAVSRYERALREPQSDAAASPPSAYVRSAAFRSVVVELYDYRCAATGHRVLLEGGEAMVEAAHIHPFSISGDDDPRNGIALTPDMHWAMDRNLIAPGPDMCWHVSQALDDRVPDLHRLVALQNRRMLLPENQVHWPKENALAWRVQRLRDPYWRPPVADAGI